ncbi:MAG: Wadjet anti-phage system protein JetD domain-containing protein [Candidatus Nanopelagicales bacterium]
MTRKWSNRGDVIGLLDREWTSGRLLGARVPMQDSPNAPWPRVTTSPFRVRLTSPDRTDLSTRWPEVTRWAEDLTSWPGVRVEIKEVSHRTLGRQALPAAVIIDTLDEVLALLRRTPAARQFDSAVGTTPPAFHRWMAAHPHRVLDEARDWPQIISSVQWLADNEVDGMYARQLDIPGVHTKVLESHKRTIADLLAEIRDRPASGSGRHWFEDRLGLLRKPAMIRSRVLDPALALVPGIPDLAMPITSFATLDLPGVDTVFITENEVNYLTLPEAAGALVIFGSGNEAPELLCQASWIHDREVHYWGDIDTHGFAILDRLRGAIPGVRSMLMDQGTLLDNRAAWVQEPSPTRRPLPNLSRDELAVYDDLRRDVHGPRVRLEQERVSFAAVRHAVATRSQPSRSRPRS